MRYMGVAGVVRYMGGRGSALCVCGGGGGRGSALYGWQG